MNTKKLIFLFLFTFALCFLILPPARAQFIQQGSKLVGTGAVGNAYQGNSVSISSDGNTALVGGSADSNYVGAAWVFTRSGGVWTQQGDKLVGTGAVNGDYGAGQGNSVSISGDGNTAIMGGEGDNYHRGATWVFTRSGGVWTQQGDKLVGTGAISPTVQGVSVSLSADGNTAIVGGYADSNYVGATWVFTRSGGVWTQQGNKLVGTDVVYQSYQGSSVSISADGNTAIIGGIADDFNRGAAWVFTRSGGVWTQQGGKLVGKGALGGAEQGVSVSISADGNTAIVGGFLDSMEVGAAWVFTRSGGVWTQQGSKLVGTGAVGLTTQGVSVSISADGNTAIIGGPRDNSRAGAAWVFIDTTTGTAVEDKSIADFSYRLWGNYPNPFNPQTKISFSLRKESYITLKVYDLLGREVATLVNEKKQPGEYSVTWSTEGVTSGVYFYRLVAGEIIETKRMVVMK